MTFTVRYTWAEPYLRLSASEPFRPYIPVRLQNGPTYFDTLALIDSGADDALFNLQLAQALGLDTALGEQSRGRGVGGEAPIAYFDIRLSVYGKQFPGRVGFSSHWPPSFGLLGRHDFFEAFRVGFDQRGLNVFLHALQP